MMQQQQVQSNQPFPEAFDATSHAIYITGATYGTFSGTVEAGDVASSSCFQATPSHMAWMHGRLPCVSSARPESRRK
jgi:hypothetical protein